MFERKLKQWQTKNGYLITRMVAGRSNVFLINYKQVIVLVDTSPKTRWKKLERRLHALGIENIDLLILTHTHYDHAENASRIKEKFGAKVIVHQSEAEFLARGESPLPRGTRSYSKFISRLATRKIQRFFRFQPCMPDFAIDDNYSLAAYGMSAYLIHTPGHSKGSLSLLVDNEIGLVGDCMFGVFRKTVFPPFAEDPEVLMHSWKKLLDTGCSLFLPSHGREKSRDQLLTDYQKRKQM